MSEIRTFDSGATRSNNKNKIDPESYLSPIVIKRYCEYMLSHSIQEDGKKRSGDNWQLGISKDSYIESLWRHFLDVWSIHRGFLNEDMEECLCAVMFNTMGYLHELLKDGLRIQK